MTEQKKFISISPRRAMVFAVAVGGSLGTLVRYGVTVQWPVQPGLAFPWPIFITNLIASLILGVVLGLFRQSSGRWSRHSPIRAVLAAGFIGGLGTLSLPSVETVLLLKYGHIDLAIFCALGIVIGNTVLLIAGLLIAGWRPRHEQLPAQELGL